MASTYEPGLAAGQPFGARHPVLLSPEGEPPDGARGKAAGEWLEDETRVAVVVGAGERLDGGVVTFTFPDETEWNR